MSEDKGTEYNITPDPWIGNEPAREDLPSINQGRKNLSPELLQAVGRETTRKIDKLVGLYRSFTKRKKWRDPNTIIPAIDERGKLIGHITIENVEEMDELQLQYLPEQKPEIGHGGVLMYYAVDESALTKDMTLDQRTERKLVLGKVIDSTLIAEAQKHIEEHPEDEEQFETVIYASATGVDKMTSVPDGFMKKKGTIYSALNADDCEDINYNLELFERSAKAYLNKKTDNSESQV